jgi:hypothetical protein
MITLLTDHDLEHTSQAISWCENAFGPPSVGKWDYFTYTVASVSVNMFKFHNHKYATLFRLTWSFINVFENENELIMHVLSERVHSSVKSLERMYSYKFDVSDFLVQHSRKL